MRFTNRHLDAVGLAPREALRFAQNDRDTLELSIMFLRQMVAETNAKIAGEEAKVAALNHEIAAYKREHGIEGQG